MIYFEMLLCLVFDLRVCFVRCVRYGRSVTTPTKNSVWHHRASSRITGTNSRTVRSSCRSVALYPIPGCVHPTPFLAVSTLPHSWPCPPYPIPGRVHPTPFLAVSTLPHSWLCRPYPIPCRPHLLASDQRYYITKILELGLGLHAPIRARHLPVSNVRRKQQHCALMPRGRRGWISRLKKIPRP